MAFSTVNIAVDDVSALVVGHNQVASQLSGLFATSAVFSGTVQVSGATRLSSTLTVTSLAVFSAPVSIAGSLTVTGALNATVLSAEFATSARGSQSAFVISSTLTVTSEATFSAPVTLRPLTSIVSLMWGIIGHETSVTSSVASNTAPVLLLMSAASIARIVIENLSSGTVARVGFGAYGDGGNLTLTMFGTGNTGTIAGLVQSNMGTLVAGSVANLLIRTGLSAPIVVATNSVERFRADSGGVSVASNVTVGSSLYVRSSALFSGNLMIADSAIISGTAYVYGSMTVVGTLSATLSGVAASAQFATSAGHAQSATSAGHAVSALSALFATSAGFAQSATSATHTGSAIFASTVPLRGALVYLSVAAAITANANTTVSWSSASYDTTNGLLWSAGAASQFTIPTGCSYAKLEGFMTWQTATVSTTPSWRKIFILVNSVYVPGGANWLIQGYFSHANTRMQATTAWLSVVSGDKITMWAVFDGQATISIATVATELPWMSIEIR